jgi:hypothetical protein
MEYSPCLEKAGDLKHATNQMRVCVDFEKDLGHPDAEKDAEYLVNLRAWMEKK